MKTDIHPLNHNIQARCACGFAIATTSTSKELAVSICSNCHPFFTGTERFVDTAGRIEKFNKKFAANKSQEKAAVKSADKKTAKANKKA